MKYWTEYQGHEPVIVGRGKYKYDNTIYTFDIETTSYLTLDGNIIPAHEYLQLNQEDRERSVAQSNMYIWQLSINDQVYYGRTWDDLDAMLTRIDNCVKNHKIIFIHNLAFEFQYLSGIFKFKEVRARKSRKVMMAKFEDWDFELRCSYLMSNAALKELPRLFNLPVEKRSVI